jgi:hypothetical protein
MKGCIKAKQHCPLRLIMIAAYFEAWRVGDSIPDGDIPRGSEQSKHYKAQKANAKAFRQRWNYVNNIEGGELDQVPHWEHFMPLQNPRDWFANLLRFCVGTSLLTWHQITLEGIEQGQRLLAQTGVVFTNMNINLTPSFHAATHLPDHLLKYSSIYNTSTAQFERANRLLINVNKNGHGGGEMEATMATLQKPDLLGSTQERYGVPPKLVQPPGAPLANW